MQQNPNLFAGLGPFAGLAQAGSQLATRGIQGLFGIKDPVLERNRILSQLNYDDPESIRAAAQALMAQGDVEAGMQLANQARQIQQQERQFGLQERQTAATEKRIENEQLNQAARLNLSKQELELKRDELKQRSDLTKAQIDKAYAEIERLDKGDYYIVEQKGGDLGTTTVGFIAINKRNPADQRTISLAAQAPLTVEGSVVPPKAAWQYVPGKGMVKNEDK